MREHTSVWQHWGMKILRCGMTVMAALLVSFSASAQRSGTTAVRPSGARLPLSAYTPTATIISVFGIPVLTLPFPVPKPAVAAQTRRQEVCANIGVCVVDEDFRPDALVRMAPTGCPTDGRFVTRCATITTPLALVQFFKPRLDAHRRLKQICVFMRAQYFLDNGQGTIRRSCNQCVESRDLNRI